jgi:hypothetical protein
LRSPASLGRTAHEIEKWSPFGARFRPHKKKAVDGEALALSLGGKNSSADEFRRGIDAAEFLVAAELRVDAQGSDRD